MAVEQNNRTPAPAAAAPVAEEAPVATPVATPAAEVEALEPPPEDGHVEVVSTTRQFKSMPPP